MCNDLELNFCQRFKTKRNPLKCFSILMTFIKQSPFRWLRWSNFFKRLSHGYIDWRILLPFQSLAESSRNETWAGGTVWGLHRRPGSRSVGRAPGSGLRLPWGDPAKSLRQKTPFGSRGHQSSWSHSKSRCKNSSRFVWLICKPLL